MRAAQFAEFGAPLDLVDLPDPDPPPGGAVIKVEAAGLCRSDWHAWQGHDPDVRSLPHVPGHEFAGTVAGLGDGVEGYRLGDRVTVPFACGCGRCGQCATGNTQVCPDQFQPGVHGQGAFAELVAVPHAQTNLVRLPEAIAFEAAAALGCRFATAFRALAHPEQAALREGERVAVFGCGGVGLSAVMVAGALGAEVTAIDIRPGALERAAELGAHETRHPEDTGGPEFQVTVDALGGAGTCVAAIESLAPRGRHVQIGLLLGDDASPSLPVGRMIANELKFVGSHGMGVAGYPEMLGMITAGKLDPAALVAGRIGLEELPAAIAAMGDFSNPEGLTIVDRFR